MCIIYNLTNLLLPGEGNGNQLQYSCLENPMDRGAWGLQSMGSQSVGHDRQQRSEQIVAHLPVLLRYD